MDSTWSASHPLRRGIVALVASLLAVLLFATPVAAGETRSVRDDPQSTENLSPATLATMRRQERLQPALQAIWDEHYRNPRSGFAGVAFEGDGLTLYWKGALTSGMSAAVTAARRVGLVAVEAAAFSVADLQAYGDRILARSGELGGSEIQSVGFAPDGSAVIVELLPRTEVAQRNKAARAAGEGVVATPAQVLSGLEIAAPLRFTALPAAIELTGNGTRTADIPPWNGGDRWYDFRNGTAQLECTTGFGVHNGSIPHSWVLTAAHCGSVGDSARHKMTPLQPYYLIGPVNTDNDQYDLMLIDADGWFLIYDGSPSTDFTKRVMSWGYWAANELVCHSGATSGTVCDLRQQYSTDIVVTCQPGQTTGCGHTIRGLIRTTQLQGSTAVRGGDSGGPVFTLDGVGVRAKGIICAGSGSLMYFQDWHDVIRLFNAYPNVSSSWT